MPTTLQPVPPPYEPDPALGAAIRELRDASRRSQEAIAHEVGLTVGSYARIERGLSNPTWSTVRRVARAFDLTIAELAAVVERHDTRDA